MNLLLIIGGVAASIIALFFSIIFLTIFLIKMIRPKKKQKVSQTSLASTSVQKERWTKIAAMILGAFVLLAILFYFGADLLNWAYEISSPLLYIGLAVTFLGLYLLLIKDKKGVTLAVGIVIILTALSPATEVLNEKTLALMSGGEELPGYEGLEVHTIVAPASSWSEPVPVPYGKRIHWQGSNPVGEVIEAGYIDANHRFRKYTGGFPGMYSVAFRSVTNKSEPVKYVFYVPE